ncbi:MAG: hypothetical protein ABFQ62_01500 [Patescibacteria group bacterium]
MKNLLNIFPKSAEFKSSKQILMILISLQILVLGFVIYVLKSREGGVGSSDNLSYTPIWFAVMIPILASTKKLDAKQEKKSFWMILVGLAVLVLLGMLLFLLKTIN